jgi:hypothetical protein
LKKTYSAQHLKQILIDIEENGTNVCVRFRQIGELWSENFVRVIRVTDDRVLVNDEVKNKLISFDLNAIVQFEVDQGFKSVEPHNHYDVKL